MSAVIFLPALHCGSDIDGGVCVKMWRERDKVHMERGVPPVRRRPPVPTRRGGLAGRGRARPPPPVPTRRGGQPPEVSKRGPPPPIKPRIPPPEPTSEPTSEITSEPKFEGLRLRRRSRVETFRGRKLRNSLSSGKIPLVWKDELKKIEEMEEGPRPTHRQTISHHGRGEARPDGEKPIRPPRLASTLAPPGKRPLCNVEARPPMRRSEGIEIQKPNEGLRKMAVSELLTTERDYSSDLEVIMQVWYPQLKASGLLSADELETLFRPSSLILLQSLSNELCKELAGVEELARNSQDVGRRFSIFTRSFLLYKSYCSEQEIGIRLLGDLMREGSRLEAKVASIALDPRCRGLLLNSFLIKPMQRITKYPLLIQEIIRHTSKAHMDYPMLERCCKDMNDIVAEINEGAKQAEGLRKLSDLQMKLRTKGVSNIQIVSPARKFVFEAEFSRLRIGGKSVKNVVLYVFNDSLIVVMKKGEKRLDTVTDLLALRDATFWNLTATEGYPAVSIVIRDGSHPSTLVFKCADEKEVEGTIAQLENTINHLY